METDNLSDLLIYIGLALNLSPNAIIDPDITIIVNSKNVMSATIYQCSKIWLSKT